MYIPFTNTAMLLSEPRAGFGCDCLHVAAASPPPECHGDPCQTGSLTKNSNTVPKLDLVLLILDIASYFRNPQTIQQYVLFTLGSSEIKSASGWGVITSLQSSILVGRKFPGYPTTSRPPRPSPNRGTNKKKTSAIDRNGAPRMCRLSALLLCVMSSLIHPGLRDTP